MENAEGASSKFSSLSEPEQELYTIPGYSSWFSWDDINEIEKDSLKEFFDGSSISKTPKVYKTYRDFIINKFREEPQRKLTFTEIRKSLIGDVNLIHKVFLFLEKWGLINFISTTSSTVDEPEIAAEESSRVKLEEGAPNGIRVVAVPNPSKIVLLSPTPSGNDAGEAVKNGYRLPPLASYSDVFGNLLSRKESVCANCGENCVSGRYESTKGNIVVCIKCFKSEKYEESKTVDDFKFIDCNNNDGANLWTDAETFLLLESVLKHGDDWDLVAKEVQTKSKIECISRLIELPFGEVILGSTNQKDDGGNLNGSTSNVKQGPPTSVDSQEPIKRQDQCKNEVDLIGKDEVQGPPSKKRCMDAFVDASSSLMRQVALLSTMVEPDVTAAAAEAAVGAMCSENQHVREIFEGMEDKDSDQFGFPNSTNKIEGHLSVAGLKMGERNTESETDVFPPENIPLALRIRAAIATGFGGAAAHAKLLADQEDREIEHLMATIIETQLKKIHCKIKHFQELELIMEKEYSLVQQLKESLIKEWIDVLHGTFDTGISRWKDHSTVKSFVANVF